MSEPMRATFVRSYFTFVLEKRNAFEHAAGDRKASLAEWSDLFMRELKERFIGRKPEAEGFLTAVCNSLDRAIEHISHCEDWLRQELGLPPRQRPNY